MENEEIMMNETTEAMTDVEEPITETETNEEDSGSYGLLIAGCVAVGGAALYGLYKFGKEHAVPTVANGIKKVGSWFGGLKKGKADVEAEAEEVEETHLKSNL